MSIYNKHPNAVFSKVNNSKQVNNSDVRQTLLHSFLSVKLSLFENKISQTFLRSKAHGYTNYYILLHGLSAITLMTLKN